MIQTAAYNIIRSLVFDDGSNQAIVNADITMIMNAAIQLTQAANTDRGVGPVAFGSGFALKLAAGEYSCVPVNQSVMLVTQVTREAADGQRDGTPLERVAIEVIHRLRKQSVANGTPRYVAIERLDGTGAGNNIRVVVHPPATATTTLAVQFIAFPTTMTATGSDAMDLPLAAQYRVIREAAVDLAIVLGRPLGFIQSILGRSDEQMKLYQSEMAESHGEERSVARLDPR